MYWIGFIVSHPPQDVNAAYPLLHGNSISFFGGNAWGNFPPKVPPNPFKNFQSRIKWI